MVRIAFLEGCAGIALGQTLRFGRCERNKGTVEATKIWGPKTGCPYIPSDIGSQRRPYLHGPNAGNIETVCVRFWNKYLVARPEQRRQFCQHSPVGAEQRTEVQKLQFVEHWGKGDAGDVRECLAGGVERDERLGAQARII